MQTIRNEAISEISKWNFFVLETVDVYLCCGSFDCVDLLCVIRERVCRTSKEAELHTIKGR